MKKKTIERIKAAFWKSIQWIVLHDGNTINHYIASERTVIKDEFGNVKVWKDVSGHGNDANTKGKQIKRLS